MKETDLSFLDSGVIVEPFTERDSEILLHFKNYCERIGKKIGEQTIEDEKAFCIEFGIPIPNKK